jgi:hypothetical protein
MERRVPAVMATSYNQVGISTLSGCVSDRGEQSGGVVVVESGHRVAQVDGNASSEAGR